MKFKILTLILVFFIGIVSMFFTNNSFNKTHIIFSSWGSESELQIIKPIIMDYENSHPQIKIDFMHIPQNYFQKIHLLFAANTEPDVIFINNIYLPVYANANKLEPLDKYFTSEELKKYYPQGLESMRFNKKLYAIPRDLSNLVIFYNKTLFDKYGIKYPTPDWDYKNFLEIAQKATIKGNTFGISFEEDPYFYLPYLMNRGGGFLPDKYYNKKTKEGLKFYADLRKKYHVAPTKQEIGSSTSAQMFLDGKLAMHLSGRWIVPKYKKDAIFEWDVINFPSGPEGDFIPMDSSGWALAKSAKHKKECIEFIKYLSNYENISKITKSGLIVPARIDVTNSSVFQENPKVFIYAIEHSHPTPVSVNYREILDKIKLENEKLLN